MPEKIEMIVKMQVTIPQALALKTMFEHWNKMASWGCSRRIAFYVDGDGNFKPKAEVILPSSVPELTDEMRAKALIEGEKSGDAVFDFDPIAWMLQEA